MPFVTYAKTQGSNYRGGRRGRYVTKNYLKAIIGVPETKFVDTTVTPTAAQAFINTAVTYNLNNPPQGDGESERIGNEISNKSLHMRLDIKRAAVDSLVRVIIFWNLDGSNTPISSLLENNTGGQAYQSPLNKTQGKTFWVRFDRTYTIAAGQTQLVVDEIWRRFKCKTEWASDVSTAITANSLYVVFISDQTETANQPLFSFTSRVTYLDV